MDRSAALHLTTLGNPDHPIGILSSRAQFRITFFLPFFFLLFGLAFCAVLFFSFSNAWWDFGVPWTSAIGRTQGKWRLMFSRMIWDESKAAKGVGRPKRMFDG
jgi:hypothetical protein